MSKKDVAIVFDCGATNMRVIAMDVRGKIVASESVSNNTSPDPLTEGGVIWDVESMWQKLSLASKKVMAAIDTSRIVGVTVTTFGVDGAFVDEQGKMLYPVISWQCERTAPVMENIGEYLPLQELYAEAGTFPYAFNTINKFIWMKENRPDVIEKAYRFLFITSLFIFKLSGKMKNDITMAGTSMLMDTKKQQPSEKIFSALDIDPAILGDLVESGEKAGVICEKAAEETSIPKGVGVFFAGHDTQFALYGSGAELNQPVLSSGTWEILMTRSNGFSSTEDQLKVNLTTEIDSISGIYNIGQNWLSSGVVEWFTGNFYAGLSGDELYETIIAEAGEIKPGANGVQVIPSFYKESNEIKGGALSGLTIATKRAEIMRAVFEGLAFRLREGLEALQSSGNFKAERIICVGGGSKNSLWNQIRADVCNVPIQLIDQKETTVLGGALFVFKGAGVCNTVEEARDNIDYNPFLVHPSEDVPVYDKLYKAYLKQKDC